MSEGTAIGRELTVHVARGHGVLGRTPGDGVRPAAVGPSRMRALWAMRGCSNSVMAPRVWPNIRPTEVEVPITLWPTLGQRGMTECGRDARAA